MFDGKGSCCEGGEDVMIVMAVRLQGVLFACCGMCTKDLVLNRSLFSVQFLQILTHDYVDLFNEVQLK